METHRRQRAINRSLYSEFGMACMTLNWFPRNVSYRIIGGPRKHTAHCNKYIPFIGGDFNAELRLVK